MSTRKSPFTWQSESVFDVVAVREAWSEMITQCEADKLVFLDESGLNTDLSRRYGRAIGGEWSVDKSPLNAPTNTTIRSPVRLNGETAYTIYSGGTGLLTKSSFGKLSGHFHSVYDELFKITVAFRTLRETTFLKNDFVNRSNMWPKSRRFFAS